MLHANCRPLGLVVVTRSVMPGGKCRWALWCVSSPRPICRRLLRHAVRPGRLARRLYCRKHQRDQHATIAITTSNSTSVNTIGRSAAGPNGAWHTAKAVRRGERQITTARCRIIDFNARLCPRPASSLNGQAIRRSNGKQTTPPGQSASFHTSLRPSRRTACHALVGLLTSELESTGLLVVPGVFVNAQGDNGHSEIGRFHLRFIVAGSVTAAGPSRNCTGVPLSVGRKSTRDRPPTHNSRQNLSMRPASVKRMAQAGRARDRLSRGEAETRRRPRIISPRSMTGG